MKYLIPVICSLLLAGCNTSSDTASSANGQSTETAPAPLKAADTPVEQNSTPVSEATTPTNAPEEKVVASNEKQEAPSATTSAAVDGSVVFNQKCVSCHGSKAEKPALGKSQVIAGWEESKIVDALKGYQNGTYGKEMKMVMQGQAKGLNDAQINAVAKYISSL